MQINELVHYLNTIFPPQFQESYDNSGLIVGRETHEINKALLTLDITEEVLEEAIDVKADIIIAHHPIIFKAIKKIGTQTEIDIIIRKAIKHDIAIFAAHTNMDSAKGGTNDKLCELLKLNNCKVLSPIESYLYKIVVFVPEKHASEVRDAMFENGAGQIGEYDSCSFNINGEGTFKAGDNTNPYVGKKGEIHKEPEIRIETVAPKHLLSKVINKMIKAHPYEEVAYDIYPIENNYEAAGLGRIGELNKPMDEKQFLEYVKTNLKADHLRYSGTAKKIQKVAVCSGSGAFLSRQAIMANADAYISGDFKYHEFQEASKGLFVIDAGHYDTEKYVKDIFYEHIMEKFPKFALYLSKVNTNPINLY
jgi:dinuclear metal center YbgI/SA1388 family protein